MGGRTTAVAVTRAYLDRIEAFDRRGPYLNSLITVKMAMSSSLVTVMDWQAI